jgi:hypothetical protein
MMQNLLMESVRRFLPMSADPGRLVPSWRLTPARSCWINGTTSGARCAAEGSVMAVLSCPYDWMELIQCHTHETPLSYIDATQVASPTSVGCIIQHYHHHERRMMIVQQTISHRHNN